MESSISGVQGLVFSDFNSETRGELSAVIARLMYKYL